MIGCLTQIHLIPSDHFKIVALFQPFSVLYSLMTRSLILFTFLAIAAFGPGQQPKAPPAPAARYRPARHCQDRLCFRASGRSQSAHERYSYFRHSRPADARTDSEDMAEG